MIGITNRLDLFQSSSRIADLLSITSFGKVELLLHEISEIIFRHLLKTRGH